MNTTDERKRLIAKIHVAKNRTGLDDEAYRALLFGAAGVESAADIETMEGFDAVLDAFRHFGFREDRRGLQGRPVWTDAWGCTDRQRAKIEAMWRSFARDRSDRALRHFIARVAKVESPAWLDSGKTSMVIVALSRMMRKAGIDPETGRKVTNA